jgi:hypothetical protein
MSGMLDITKQFQTISGVLGRSTLRPYEDHSRVKSDDAI